MSFERIEPDFGQAPDPGVSRIVTVRRVKKQSFMSTECKVGGAICLVRTNANSRVSWLVRFFGLTPPEMLGDGIAAYGLSDLALSALKHDPDFVKAVSTLLGMGTRLALQKGQLVLTVGNGHVKSSQPVLSSCIGIAAARIEALGGQALNDYVDHVRLNRPYGIYALAAGVVFGLCFGFDAPSLAPLKMFLRWLECGGLLTLAVAGVLLPWHLRRNPLAGAVVSTAFTSTVIGSLMLGAGAASLMNTYLGEKRLAPRDVHLTGTVVVTHGRHVSCWLYADQSTLNSEAGQPLQRVPLQCGEVHYHADPIPHVYDLAVNPGLLGVPFVQSVSELDEASPAPYVPVNPVPFHAPVFHPDPPTSASMPYVAKLARRIDPNIVWQPTGVSWKTSVAVRCASDGKILSVSLTRSSGNHEWDTAVLTAIRNSDPLPVDNNGKAPPHFNLTIHSREK